MFFFNFRAGQHDLTAAAHAADLEIHADTQHFKAGSPAGVLLAGEDGISHSDIHSVGRSLLPPLRMVGGNCAAPGPQALPHIQI